MTQQTSDIQCPLFDTVVVVGVGLIGGSLAKALREQQIARRVIGVGRTEDSLKCGVQLGVIDDYQLDLRQAVATADLIVLAAPVLSTASLLERMAGAIPEQAIVTDVGSAKGVVVDAFRKTDTALLPRLVPGHPIAGSEQSGVAAADEALFQRHRVILTPLPETRASALQQVRLMWELVGAEVIEMAVDRHDQVLAATSHLPHLLAFSLVDTLASEDDNLEIFKYAAGGFRDFTRIAASDPVMWHDIFVANRDAVLQSLDHFSTGLASLKSALESGDSQAMKGVFTRAKSARDHFTNLLTKRAYMHNRIDQTVKSGAQAASLAGQPEPAATTFIAEPGGTVAGHIRVPGDKSISHRSIMLGALAEGETRIEGFLEGEDSLATLQSFRDMGVVIEGPQAGRVTVHGVGLGGLSAPPGPLYLGNSGTSMRLLAGLLSAQRFDVTLTGDDSLSKRPMERVAGPLRRMGAQIDSEEGTPPLTITGDQQIKGIHYDMPVASAQVKSSLLLAGLYAQGTTSVVEPAPTRDHTERMLTGFGYPVAVEELSPVARKISVTGGGQLTGSDIDVPADISSAAFFMVAASIAPGSDLLLEHVGVNPTRLGVINILKLMGADLSLQNERVIGGEPVADIRVRYSGLRGIEIPVDQVPLAIDEFPVLFVAAACAEGQTVLTGAEELRVKESDRIQVMADGLVTLGVDARATADGMIIEGGEIGGGTVISHGDHRIAMAFAVAALRASAPITILDCANVATSFPNFIELAARVGMKVGVSDKGPQIDD